MTHHETQYINTDFELRSNAAKAELGACHVRMFNVGFSCGCTERVVHELSSDLMKAIAEASCSMTMTLYSAATPH